MNSLPQLRESLICAGERQAEHSEGRALPSRRWKVRRPSLARRGSVLLMFVAGLLTLAAVAYATTQLIQTGSPVRSEEHFFSNTGVGVAIPKTEGLLGIAAPDPVGGPPWTMRVYDTSRGLGCAQVGRLVGGRIGVLGQDGAFHDDGRFHPLPTQASQAEGNCVLLDAHGHAFLGVGTYDEPASGLPRECHLLGSRAASERCARSDPRDVFYGLLGPDARSITYTAEGHISTIPTVGSQGAYLIVERAPAALTTQGVETAGMGSLPAGVGSVSARGLKHTLILRQPIRKITYTGGRTCSVTRHGYRNGHGKSCLPPVGYITQQIHIPSAREMASPIQVHPIFDQPVPGRPGARQAELLVSFTAHAAVNSALSGYNVFVEQPYSGTCARGPGGAGAGEGLARNVKAGERVQVTVYSGEQSPGSLFPGCPGIAHGTVTYNVPSGELSSVGSYGPFVREHSRTVVVGHFTYQVPR